MQRRWRRQSLTVLLVLALVIAPLELFFFYIRGQNLWHVGSGGIAHGLIGKTFTAGDLEVGVPPRVYQPWGARDLPCFDEVMGSPKLVHGHYNFYEQNQNNRKGFLYMRPPKCASTTLAGVNLRIARNVARRRRPNNNNVNMTAAPMMCDMSYSHGGTVKGRRFSSRVRGQSYLWTMIREPTSRHVSFFWFWGVSVKRMNSSDESMQDFLLMQEPDYYFSYLSPRYNPLVSRSGRNSTMSKNQVIDEATYILKEYDFIGITEKLDESLVVLMMLLDLPMADILYYTAKKAEDNLYMDPLSINKKCMALTPSSTERSDGMKEFFATDTWKERVYSDELLYRAAKQSLERTIHSLGREKVQEHVAKLRQAQSRVVEQCRGTIRMECQAVGEPPNKEFDCMHHDVGCGMDCIDQVATELSLW